MSIDTTPRERPVNLSLWCPCDQIPYGHPVYRPNPAYDPCFNNSRTRFWFYQSPGTEYICGLRTVVGSTLFGYSMPWPKTLRVRTEILSTASAFMDLLDLDEPGSPIVSQPFGAGMFIAADGTDVLPCAPFTVTLSRTAQGVWGGYNNSAAVIGGVLTRVSVTITINATKEDGAASMILTVLNRGTPQRMYSIAYSSSDFHCGSTSFNAGASAGIKGFGGSSPDNFFLPAAGNICREADGASSVELPESWSTGVGITGVAGGSVSIDTLTTKPTTVAFSEGTACPSRPCATRGTPAANNSARVVRAQDAVDDGNLEWDEGSISWVGNVSGIPCQLSLLRGDVQLYSGVLIAGKLSIGDQDVWLEIAANPFNSGTQASVTWTLVADSPYVYNGTAFDSDSVFSDDMDAQSLPPHWYLLPKAWNISGSESLSTKAGGEDLSGFTLAAVAQFSGGISAYHNIYGYVALNTMFNRFWGSVQGSYFAPRSNCYHCEDDAGNVLRTISGGLENISAVGPVLCVTGGFSGWIAQAGTNYHGETVLTADSDNRDFSLSAAGAFLSYPEFLYATPVY